MSNSGVMAEKNVKLIFNIKEYQFDIALPALPFDKHVP